MFSLSLLQDLGALLLAVATAFYLVRPHLSGWVSVAAPVELQRELQVLLEHKERSIQVIKDLELDRATGKISDAEFERMRTALTAELASILARIDSDSSAPGRVV